MMAQRRLLLLPGTPPTAKVFRLGLVHVGARLLPLFAAVRPLDGGEDLALVPQAPLDGRLGVALAVLGRPRLFGRPVRPADETRAGTLAETERVDLGAGGCLKQFIQNITKSTYFMQ